MLPLWRVFVKNKQILYVFNKEEEEKCSIRRKNKVFYRILRILFPIVERLWHDFLHPAVCMTLALFFGFRYNETGRSKHRPILKMRWHHHDF